MPRSIRAPPAVAFALCALIWGSTWLAIKVGYGGIGALTGAALRFAIAAVVLFALIPVFGAPLPRTRRDWGLAAWIGLLLFGLDYGLIYWGEQFIDSGLTAVLFATNTLLTAFVAHAALRAERLTATMAAGILLGLVGLVLVFAGRIRIDAGAAVPMLAIVGAAFAAAVSNVGTRKWAAGAHPATYTGAAMLVGAIALAAAALALGEPFTLPTTATAWVAVLYLAIAGSVVSFLLFFDLLQKWGASRSSLITFVVPVVALALGSIVLRERPTLPEVGGAALVLAGVWLSSRSSSRSQAAKSAPSENRTD